MRSFLMTALLIASPTPLFADSSADSSLIDRVGDTGFVQVRINSFDTLDSRQQELAYWLTQAAIAVDPIIYDQLSKYGLRQKRLLDGIIAHPGSDPAETRILAFTKLFWANRGNHNDTTARKFLPGFTAEEFSRVAHAARKRGAFASRNGTLPALTSDAALEREIKDLEPSLFDATFEPMIIAKNPESTKDILQASSNTFYENVSLADLKGFVEKHPLNSRLVKRADGTLQELVYRAGTPDGKIAPGLYAIYLRKANGFLARAKAVADPEQAKVIAALIRYYETGDFQDWIQFGTLWVQNNAVVDFSNGFVELYWDARGAKGAIQGFVSITDKPITETMSRLAQNAAYFEAHAPWADQYKRQAFKTPSVKAVEMLAETGDFHITTVGDNLPNENVIHEKYGTKNFLITSSTRALDKAIGTRAYTEFADGPDLAARNDTYGSEAEDLDIALHEVIGHGSGKLSERVQGGAAPYLKEYYSTLEEARADLMALWNINDPKLVELGLISNQEEVAKTLYDITAANLIMQLRRIPEGNTIEENHERDRQLIVNYIRDRVPDAIKIFERDGKTSVRVTDYSKMREGVGMLLTELMRIKAEGDYAAIKSLVDAYGVHFDPALRDQVVARYKKLDSPTYWAGVDPILAPDLGKDGRITKVRLQYPRSAVDLYLPYGRMFDSSLR